jgi:hypothetical protein
MNGKAVLKKIIAGTVILFHIFLASIQNILYPDSGRMFDNQTI